MFKKKGHFYIKMYPKLNKYIPKIRHANINEICKNAMVGNIMSL